MDPTFDFILMDIDVVHLDGVTLTSTIRKFEKRHSREHIHIIIGISEFYHPDNAKLNAQKEISNMVDICKKDIDCLNKCDDKYARTAMNKRINQESIDDQHEQGRDKLVKL